MRALLSERVPGEISSFLCVRVRQLIKCTNTNLIDSLDFILDMINWAMRIESNIRTGKLKGILCIEIRPCQRKSVWQIQNQ